MSGAVTAAVVGGTIAAGAGIAGSAIQAGAAGKAANTQAQAAQNALDYQKQATQQALGYQQQQNQQTQQNLAPYQQYGLGGLSNLGYLLGIGPQSNVAQNTNTPFQASIGNTSTPAGSAAPGGPGAVSSGVYNPNGSNFSPAQSQVQSTNPGLNTFSPNGPTASPVGGGWVGTPISAGQIPQSGANGANVSATSAPPGVNTSLGGFGSLMTPYQDFTAPTGLTMENDPGYQARLQLGADALQKSAAARGNVLTGGTAKALDTYAQDYASNEYGNVYNRALEGYQTNQGNYYTGQNNQYNRLMGLVSGGQNAATAASSLGQSGANSISNTIMGGAQAANQQANNAAAATASGYVGGANAWGQGLSGVGGNISNLLLLKQLGGNNSGGLTAGGQLPYSTGPLATANS